MSQQGKPVTEAEPASMTPDTPRASAQTDPMAEHIHWAVSTWPQIDPDVEGIVSRVDKIGRYLQNAFRASLGQAGLTKEEWKVIMALSRGVRSHGWLCRDLDVSTGAMTNRLDKLEARGLIKRAPDPDDRRGVLLELTEGGRERLDGYVDAGASREKELLSGLSPAEKSELNALLSKLLLSLQRREPDPR
ncbi:MAG: MarR family winged helix-turn-helix transcriptional regulator [Solirubrobacteraceae bacterium]